MKKKRYRLHGKYAITRTRIVIKKKSLFRLPKEEIISDIRSEFPFINRLKVLCSTAHKSITIYFIPRKYSKEEVEGYLLNKSG